MKKNDSLLALIFAQNNVYPDKLLVGNSSETKGISRSASITLKARNKFVINPEIFLIENFMSSDL